MTDPERARLSPRVRGHPIEEVTPTAITPNLHPDHPVVIALLHHHLRLGRPPTSAVRGEASLMGLLIGGEGGGVPPAISADARQQGRDARCL